MKVEKFWDWYESFAAPKLATFPQMDRSYTFRKMFEHLESLDRPVHIVETGCIESDDNFGGNGCSTILFDKYAETHPGTSVRSYEINEQQVLNARDICKNVWFYCGDSVEGLKKLAEHGPQIDLLYLDASSHNWILEIPSQVHHYNELMTVMPLLHEDSLVAVDDSLISVDDYPQQKVIGKGGLVAEYAFEIGAEMQFCDYQVGFTKITGSLPSSIEDIEALILRARKLVEANYLPAADRIYRLIIHATAKPWKPRARIARGEACVHFARTARLINKFGIAMDWFNMALEADPLAVDYRCELSRTMTTIGALRPGKRQAVIATTIEPEESGVWSNLGGIEADNLNESGVIYAYDRQIETAEASGNAELMASAYLNRGTIALDTRDHARVRELCEKVFKLNVFTGDAWHLLAMLEYRAANHELAIELFDKALENNARNKPLTHWNKALPMEAIGMLKASRAEHAWGEKELTVQALYVPQHRFFKPKWRGQGPVTNDRKTILHIHSEAGFGDNLSVARYFPILIERGYEVHYETDPRMVDLMQYSFPDVQVMARAKDYPGVVGLKEFDYHIPMGDLMGLMGTDLDTIPWEGPYLKADPELSKKFAEKLKGSWNRKVGLCWSSGIRFEQNIWIQKYGRAKSMYFPDLMPIVKALDTRDFIVSLQVGDGVDEHKGIISDLLSPEPTWAETAALIENLDLVITVDTGVAHLAGAMGKPTWVMMQRDGASWHFMCWRPGAVWNESSPWYPSARIFRQHRFGEPGYWKDVVDDVARELQQMTLAAAAE